MVSSWQDDETVTKQMQECRRHEMRFPPLSSAKSLTMARADACCTTRVPL
jgi:hypothetical protein